MKESNELQHSLTRDIGIKPNEPLCRVLVFARDITISTVQIHTYGVDGGT